MSGPHLEATSGVRARPRFAALRRAWPLGVALLVIAVICSGLWFSRPGRAATISAFVLPDMLVDLPVRPVTWVTADPIVERERVPYDGGSILADVYRPPGDGPHAAIIFSMGAPPLALDDARLVKLAEATARAGMVMIVPFSDRLDAEQIEPEEINALVGIFQFAEAQPYIDPERVGYIGVSVGGSLALVAASDERIADRVDFVVSFGAYYNALDALEAIGAHKIRYDGLEEDWEPDPHSVEVMARQIISGLSDPDDRALLCRKFVDSSDQFLCQVAGAEAPSDGQVSIEGRTAYQILTNGGPVSTRELFGELPSSVITRLSGISPNRVIDRLQAEVFIIHDRGDKFIPYVESRRLRDALAGRERVHFTEVSLFEHVEPRLSSGGDVLVLDGTRLYYLLYRLLLDLS